MFSIPPLWTQITCAVIKAYAFESTSGLLVMIGEEKIEGKWWRHVSVSRQDRIPNYADLGSVKSAFIGDHRAAIQVFPKKDEHVNIHPRCLHLWSPVDEKHYPLPDFRIKGRDGSYGL
jgi:hypothetical protein